MAREEPQITAHWWVGQPWAPVPVPPVSPALPWASDTAACSFPQAFIEHLLCA